MFKVLQKWQQPKLIVWEKLEQKKKFWLKPVPLNVVYHF